MSAARGFTAIPNAIMRDASIPPSTRLLYGVIMSYAWSGLVSWGLAALFIAGGIAGGLAGTRSARHLSERRGALNIVFAAVIIAVAIYMLARNLSAL